MNDRFEEKLKVVEEALIETIKEFQEKPINFFYEEDIRAFLFMKIYEGFESNNLKIETVEDEAGYNKDALSINAQMNPVKAEFYPQKGPSKGCGMGIDNVDIAILSDNPIEVTKTNSYLHPIDIAIEVKFSSYTIDEQHAKFLADFSKVCSYSSIKNNFVGIAIYFDRKIVNDESMPKYSELKLTSTVSTNLKLVRDKNYAVYVPIGLSGNHNFLVYSINKNEE
jgi:hypothetical protein